MASAIARISSSRSDRVVSRSRASSSLASVEHAAIVIVSYSLTALEERRARRFAKFLTFATGSVSCSGLELRRSSHVGEQAFDPEAKNVHGWSFPALYAKIKCDIV